MKIQPLQMTAAHLIYVNHDYHCCQRYIRSTFFTTHTNRGIGTCQSTEMITWNYMYSTHDGKLETKHT